MKTMIEKLNYVHFAIQEGLNGNEVELEQALAVVEDLRELWNNHVFEYHQRDDYDSEAN
jgi:hypothetical protein